jgi:oxalate decarboxylase/phosphoglucose isomerase-like protein (cupin superfamily)
MGTSPTTLLKRRDEMPRRPLPNCHDGIGSLDWTEVLNTEDLPGRAMKFFHDDIIPPGASIGIHVHADDEEYYYFLSGEGLMTLDGRTFPVAAGDITAVFPGGSHGLENTGTTDMRIIVVCVEPQTARTR